MKYRLKQFDGSKLFSHLAGFLHSVLKFFFKYIKIENIGNKQVINRCHRCLCSKEVQRSGSSLFCFFHVFTCIHKIISNLRTIREPMAFILYACLFYAKSTVRECGTTCVRQLLICDERTVLCQPLCRLYFCTDNRDRWVSGWAKNNYVKVGLSGKHNYAQGKVMQCTHKLNLKNRLK